MTERMLKIERIWGKLDGLAQYQSYLREKGLSNIHIAEAALETLEKITKEFDDV